MFSEADSTTAAFAEKLLQTADFGFQFPRRVLFWRMRPPTAKAVSLGLVAVGAAVTVYVLRRKSRRRKESEEPGQTAMNDF